MIRQPGTSYLPNQAENSNPLSCLSYRKLCKAVILPAFCLIAKIKSSNRTTMLRFYFCFGVECNQNPWFCKASL